MRKDGIAPEVPLTLSSDLEADLRDASMLVYLTASEGLGSAALLAMSAAVPVIASRVGGLPEIVRHGETGLLVENTRESIEAAIRELTGDPALARRLGEAGRRAIAENFTIAHMARRTMEVVPPGALPCLKLCSRCSSGCSSAASSTSAFTAGRAIFRWCVRAPAAPSAATPSPGSTTCRWSVTCFWAGAAAIAGRHISWRYPAVELMTAALFFNFVYALGPSPAALKMCVLSALLVALLFADLEQRILPDELTLGGLALGFIFALFVPVRGTMAQTLLWLAGIDVNGVAASVAEALLGAALPALFLWGAGALYKKIRHREGLGFGDVKLIAMIGAFFGLQGAIFAWLLGSVSGSIVGLAYIKAARKEAATYELPFGTFLCAAALLVAVFEKRLPG